MIERTDYGFGPDARRRTEDVRAPGRAGALAALETFYYALNSKDLETLVAGWADDPLVQLNNPVGGILRGRDAVRELYAKVFAGTLDVQVTFGDAATYWLGDSVVFAGRETGTYLGDRPLRIRTTRIFTYGGAWQQVHHHGSIDDPELLTAYQLAVRAGVGG
ncbi:limonene-1,2-epoxide hydrolase [Kribbella aluminosa]|uniref:Limonene-1,2-epoxide hydrolase n=1 Tax=Kribbella aluminosa TaxID=416017 RepID=A0ABS4UXZ4_9ACTN|nr:nuclear transport factor 2 family protein [Kribbella aluminosa]MBP2356519.1 limonene-1,2-epoxide hydrolase [Kribbella aluminosa]